MTPVKLPNREGRLVDAVPFLVAAITGFVILFSFAPGYLLSFGLSIPVALGTTFVAFSVVAVGSYHRFVRSASPEQRTEVPVSVRFRRLIYLVLIAIAVMLVLLLPVVAGWP